MDIIMLLFKVRWVVLYGSEHFSENIETVLTWTLKKNWVLNFAFCSRRSFQDASTINLHYPIISFSSIHISMFFFFDEFMMLCWRRKLLFERRMKTINYILHRILNMCKFMTCFGLRLCEFWDKICWHTKRFIDGLLAYVASL